MVLPRTICYPFSHTPPGLPIMKFSTLSRTALAATLLTLAALPLRAADDEPKGPAISTLKATKACFSNIVEVARDEAQAQVRPDWPGLKAA
jgi:HlyD family secretion protein